MKNRMRQQQVYFDHAVAGCPALRTFDIHNVWERERPLLFEIGADTPEIQVILRPPRLCVPCIVLHTSVGIVFLVIDSW